MSTTTGTIKSISGPPRRIEIQPPGDPPPSPVVFTPIPDDAWDVLNSTPKGDSVTVTGTPPNCTNASRP